MGVLHKFNSKANSTITTGFGTNATDYGGRFVNKDGMPNVEKKGVGFFERVSWFHTLLQMPGWKFFSIIIIFYALINLFFAGIYCIIGVEHLGGVIASSFAEKFGEAYFFSTQTFTTVGYGRISPIGFIASATAALEALLGLLTFALATGLFYGRFSKPKAYIRFSDNAIIAPFKDGTALMMRVATYKNNNLLDAEAKLTAGLVLEENGKLTNRFFQLDLEYSKVSALTLSWTIVHPITEDSPFYTFTRDDFKTTKGEILLYVKAFDDMFSNTVVARTSYTLDEVVIGAKFTPMYHRSDNDKKTVLDISRINSFSSTEISLPG